MVAYVRMCLSVSGIIPTTHEGTTWQNIGKELQKKSNHELYRNREQLKQFYMKRLGCLHEVSSPAVMEWLKYV